MDTFMADAVAAFINHIKALSNECLLRLMREAELIDSDGSLTSDLALPAYRVAKREIALRKKYGGESGDNNGEDQIIDVPPLQ